MESTAEIKLNEIREKISGLYRDLENSDNSLHRLTLLEKMLAFTRTREPDLGQDPVYLELLYHLELECQKAEAELLEKLQEQPERMTLKPTGLTWKWSANLRFFTYQVLCLLGLVGFNLFLGGFYLPRFFQTLDYYFFFELMGLVLVQFLFIYYLTQALEKEYFTDTIGLRLSEGAYTLEKEVPFRDEDNLLEELLMYTIGRTTYSYILLFFALLYVLTCILGQKIFIDIFQLTLDEGKGLIFGLGCFFFFLGSLWETNAYRKTRTLLYRVIRHEVLKNLTGSRAERVAGLKEKLADLNLARTHTNGTAAGGF